jgi:hypothetical protein
MKSLVLKPLVAGSIRKALRALEEGDEDAAFEYWVKAWDSL